MGQRSSFFLLLACLLTLCLACSKAGDKAPQPAISGPLGGALSGSTLDRMEQEGAPLEAQVEKNEERMLENRRLIEELKRRGADVRSSKRGVVINLPDILFEFDRARLTPEARRTIGEISDVLVTVKNREIAVEGYTDSVGTVRYNKQLSLRRAQSVARELEGKSIPSQQIRVRGYGEGAPIATNNSDSGRARNRRVEIIIEN